MAGGAGRDGQEEMMIGGANRLMVPYDYDDIVIKIHCCFRIHRGNTPTDHRTTTDHDGVDGCSALTHYYPSSR